ncbi:MAG: GNAT family N-acetyltransferase [Methanobacteriaceae archaeon]
MNNLTLTIGNETLIDEIKELWEELNQHHLEKSPNFKNHYKTFTFQMRKEKLNSYAEKGILFIIVAKIKDKKIGYCIASVKENIGEIDSIYIKPNYRKRHIGTALIEKSLNWIKSKNVDKIIANITIGNNEVFNFYSKYGFKPRLTQLEMKSKK